MNIREGQRLLIAAVSVAVAGCSATRPMGLDSPPPATIVTAPAREQPPRVTLYRGPLPDGLTTRPVRGPGPKDVYEDFPVELATEGQPRQVQFSLLVDETGRVREVEVQTSSGARGIDVRAAELASTIEFTPARRGGDAVTVWIDDFWFGWPLVVVDGKIRPGMSLPEVGALDIRHVEIIKGAVASVFYGDWVRSGLIEIYTRNGPDPNAVREGRLRARPGASSYRQ